MEMYQRFLDPIKNDIQNLRAVLNQVEIKESESGWIRRQTHGDLDDTRLVDGVTGVFYEGEIALDVFLIQIVNRLKLLKFK